MHPYIVSMHADERCGPQDLTPKCRSPTQVASRTAGAHPNRIYAHATSMTMTEHPNTISIIIRQPRPPSQKHCRELDSAPTPPFPLSPRVLSRAKRLPWARFGHGGRRTQVFPECALCTANLSSHAHASPPPTLPPHARAKHTWRKAHAHHIM